MSTVRDNVQIDFKNLRLWDYNPRMPKAMEGQPQAAIAQAMNDEFKPIEVGASIAASGWTDASVLSVTNEGMPEGTYLVVEGNRRLTALLALTDASIRKSLSNAEEWEQVAAKAASASRIPAKIPCVIYPTLKEAEEQLGSVHFLGVLAWEPYQKDRFILRRVDAGGPIAEVAAGFGFEEIDVKKAVYIYRIYESLKDHSYGQLLPRNYGNLRELILKYGAIRSHMQLPDPRAIDESYAGISDESEEMTNEVLTWVFGTSPDKGSDPDEGRKVSETRQYRKLNRIVQSARGLEALRDPLTLLDEAYAVVQAESNDPSAEFDKAAEQLMQALTKLRKLYQDEGPDVANENSRRSLRDSLELVGFFQARNSIETSAQGASAKGRAGKAPSSHEDSHGWAIWLGDSLED
jgi:hypothetical protein